MDIVVVYILLTLVRSINVGFRVLNEITPSDATDIRGFTMPVGTASFANGHFRGFKIKHILTNDGEDFSGMDTVPESPPFVLIHHIVCYF